SPVPIARTRLVEPFSGPFSESCVCSLKLSFGAMFCTSYHKMCLLTGVSLDTLAVIQSPDVSVMEGEMVNITCCWTEKIERVTVRWLKNGTIIKKQIWQNKTQGSLKKDANDCLRLIFPNITRNDSGRYICRVFVDIPIQVDRNGTGTLVTVVALESTDYDSDDHNVDGRPFLTVGTCRPFSCSLNFQVCA
uniref:Ig-like domain-containing protein n=1 Tax=Amphiprion ocellaris TaxID=80972 RepID=A0AAQ6AJR6_AMPOC